MNELLVVGMYILMYLTPRKRQTIERGKKCHEKRSEKVGKNAAAYAAEQLVLQETFLKLKI